MQELEANAIATVMIGPFVDMGDGVTPEEGITLAAADSAEVMKHNGTTFVDIAGAGANQATLTHKEKGMYTLAIPAAVISDEGRMTVFISDESVCLPVWKDFMVLAQAAWISKYTAKDTGYMDVDIKAIAGTATPNTSGKLHVLNGDGAAITAAGPTNTQLNTAIALITDDLDNVTDGLGALKALLDTISGYTDLIDDVTNGLAAIKAEVEGLGGAAMVGTDGAALASSWTAALATILANFSATRIGYLDELDFGLTEAIAAIPTTAMRGTDNVVLAGPTKAQMDTAHALLATPAQVATELGTYDAATGTELADAETALTAEIDANETKIDDNKAILDKLDSAMEADGEVSRFTENALEEGPSGTGGDATATNQETIITALGVIQTDLDNPDQYKGTEHTKL